MRFLVPFLCAVAFAQQQPVDLILHNGKIFTADAGMTIAQAVAVRGEKIVAVGASAELLRQYKAAQVIDLEGKFVQPGFDDIHIHMRGDPAYYVDLAEVKSIQEIRIRV